MMCPAKGFHVIMDCNGKVLVDPQMKVNRSSRSAQGRRVGSGGSKGGKGKKGAGGRKGGMRRKARQKAGKADELET